MSCLKDACEKTLNLKIVGLKNSVSDCYTFKLSHRSSVSSISAAMQTPVPCTTTAVSSLPAAAAGAVLTAGGTAPSPPDSPAPC